ncbi:MAG: AAA family ATPase [Syntrophaceae bacterium]|nr:AAA family ATPase [Syntrophaceae bacterium]
MYIPRINCPVKETLKVKSVLLLGPRRTGKTQYINNELKPDRIYNLLTHKDFLRLSSNPGLIGEELQKKDKLIVIDEIQKLPSLMDEIHNLIETSDIHFLLTGSSARKLRRAYTSLMAGRARVENLLPFTSCELISFDKKLFDMDKILNFGSLPPVYLSENPELELEDYAGIYLKEEIQAEAIVRKIENFSRFLTVAALSNSELINFTQISRDAQMPQRTVVEYFNILKDTLIGDIVAPFKSEKNRKSYSMCKFYFFDVGVANFLAGNRKIQKRTVAYGKAFEHFIYTELRAYKIYKNKKEPLQFWRDYAGHEVDFIIGDKLAIEVKSTEMVNKKHFKGINAFSKKTSVKRKIIISFDANKRKVKGIEIIPAMKFLDELWSDKIW